MPEVDAAAIEALAERMDEDTDDERDEDLGVFLEVAWPTRSSQDN